MTISVMDCTRECESNKNSHNPYDTKKKPTSYMEAHVFAVSATRIEVSSEQLTAVANIEIITSFNFNTFPNNFDKFMKL